MSKCKTCVEFMAHDPRGRQVSIAAGIFAGFMANPQEQGGEPLPVDVAHRMGEAIVEAYEDAFHASGHVSLEIVTDEGTMADRQHIASKALRARQERNAA